MLYVEIASEQNFGKQENTRESVTLKLKQIA